MFDLDKLREIYATLSRNKLRTFLTALGVSWGIFMLILMLGAGNGLKNGVNNEFGDYATNAVYVWARKTTKPYNGLPEGRRFRLENKDIALLENEVKEIDILSPRNQLGGYSSGNNVVHGNKAGNFDVMGDYPQIMDIQPKKILSGRFLNHLDVEETRKVTVIGKRVQDILFEAHEDPIGQYIQIRGVYFKIIGVFGSANTASQNEGETESVYIPFSTFQKAFNYINYIGWFAITAKENIPASLVEQKVKDVLKRSHQVAPDDDRAFGSFNSQEEFNKMNGLFNGINFITWIVGTLTLLAGVIGVSNIMLIIIKERTKEIGIRRAIGATPWSVINQIMLESVFLTFFAGYFGLVGGVGILELLSYAMREFNMNAEMFANPTVDLGVAMQALGILVFAGLLAGIIPANRAVQVKPVDALRTE